MPHGTSPTWCLGVLPATLHDCPPDMEQEQAGTWCGSSKGWVKRRSRRGCHGAEEGDAAGAKVDVESARIDHTQYHVIIGKHQGCSTVCVCDGKCTHDCGAQLVIGWLVKK